MTEAEINQHPFQILFNYWELRPSLVGAQLDELLRQGVTHLTSFVPWQAVESDISHSLIKFLNAVSDRRMTVSLILTPEVGIHFPNAGVPKDLMSRTDGMALHSGMSPVPSLLPPTAFHIPSLHSEAFTKRFYAFLARMDSVLSDWVKSTPNGAAALEVVLTGSFWKYYRSPSVAAQAPFSGISGDHSNAANLLFRQREDQFFSQREFSDPNPAAANRWKSRSLSDVNRFWFSQQSEDLFRNRCFQQLRRKSASIRLRELELYTPEADPSLVYSQVLASQAGGSGDFSRLSALVDEAALRSSQGGDGFAGNSIHWTGIGCFRTLSDSEKQFLILKSLLLMGSQGGCVLLDHQEWLSLSSGFRNRVENLTRTLSLGELKLKTEAYYLAPHLWSGTGTLWNELSHKVGDQAKLVSSLSEGSQDAALLMVDTAWIVTQQTVRKVLEWAKRGGVAVLPQGPLYTAAARKDLEKLSATSTPMKIQMGLSYQLFSHGEGKVVVYELPENPSVVAEAYASIQTFLSSILSLAEIEPDCVLSDPRVAVLPLHKRGGGRGTFLLNSTARSVAVDLHFASEVWVSDLGASLADLRGRGYANQSKIADRGEGATRFSLDVPAFGILPMAVEGLDDHDQRAKALERRQAADSAEDLKRSAHEAAMNSLPGMETSDGEDVWN